VADHPGSGPAPFVALAAAAAVTDRIRLGTCVILVGGNGDRVLRFAAAHADVVG
jgi:alkanesulfonate monooxygenase SsuD/methylene tetrahydromethanopterin reductase-like flavin-dependent oxidoreductase (luciferase family)